MACTMLAVVACGGHETATGRAGDIAFAQGMLPHHEQALEMAEMALVADASTAVTKLARTIARTQEPEVVLMRQWLTEWGSEEPAHGDHEMPGMASSEDLLALAAASGPDFDRRWLELMIAHHEGALESAERVLETTDDPEVAALASAVVSAQRAEIDQMRSELDREARDTP
jgi:uncharacterized protein (DUF305 family)